MQASKWMIAFLVLGLSVTSQGQNVTITGKAVDPNGAPFYTGKAQLVSGNGSGAQSWTFGGTNPVNPTRPISGLDAYGNFAIDLMNTSLIDQQSAQPEWQFNFCSSGTPAPVVCFNVPAMALTSSQSITAQINAVPPPLIPGSGSSINLASPPPIGNVTPNTGAFTTLVAAVDSNRYKVEGYPSSCTVNSVAYTTQFDCAFQTVYFTAQALSANQTLELGNAVYLTNVGMQQASLYGVNVIGPSAGETTSSQGGAVIRQNASISTAVLSLSVLSTAVSHRAYYTFRDFTIDANHNAPMCMDVNHMRESTFEHLSCEKATGSVSWVKFGTDTYPDNSGSNFNMHIGPLNVVQPFGTPATVTANVGGGNIATNGYTVNTPGSGYYATGMVTAYLTGYGAGANPCTTMPTGLHATVSGGVVTAVSSTTGASGCSGSVYVYAPDLPVAQYGFRNEFTTDSTFTDIIVEGVGNVAGIYDFGNAANTWVHPHTWEFQPVGFELHGGGVWIEPQCDAPVHYCIDFEAALHAAPAGATYSTTMYGNLIVADSTVAGASLYFIGTQYLTGLQIHDDYAPGILASDFHRFVYYSFGPVNKATPSWTTYFHGFVQIVGFQSFNASFNDKFDLYGTADYDSYMYNRPTFADGFNASNGIPLQGFSDDVLSAQTWSITSSNGGFFGAQFYASDFAHTAYGQVQIFKGTVTNSGSVSWYKAASPNAIATWTCGNNTGDDLGCTALTGGSFNVNAAFKVNGTQIVDTSQNASFASVKIGGTNSAPVVATPTVGQAACIYAAGPPVQIGKCTSVVDAGGACTCAP